MTGGPSERSPGKFSACPFFEFSPLFRRQRRRPAVVRQGAEGTARLRCTATSGTACTALQVRHEFCRVFARDAARIRVSSRRKRIDARSHAPTRTRADTEKTGSIAGEQASTDHVCEKGQISGRVARTRLKSRPASASTRANPRNGESRRSRSTEEIITRFKHTDQSGPVSPTVHPRE